MEKGSRCKARRRQMKNITKGQNETKTNKQMNIKNMKGNYQHQPNKNQRKKNEQNLVGRRFARQRSQTRENRFVKNLKHLSKFARIASSLRFALWRDSRPVPTYYYLLPLITTYHYLLLLTTTEYFLLLLTNTCYNLLLLTFCYLLPLTVYYLRVPTYFLRVTITYYYFLLPTYYYWLSTTYVFWPISASFLLCNATYFVHYLPPLTKTCNSLPSFYLLLLTTTYYRCFVF